MSPSRDLAYFGPAGALKDKTGPVLFQKSKTQPGALTKAAHSMPKVFIIARQGAIILTAGIPTHRRRHLMQNQIFQTIRKRDQSHSFLLFRLSEIYR